MPKLFAIMLATVAAYSAAASAAEIAVLSPVALRSSMNEIIPIFEALSGHKIKLEIATAGQHAENIKKGSAADLAILTDKQTEELQKEGKLVPGSNTRLARVGIGIFARKGSAQFDISSLEQLKKSLLRANSIGYNDPAGGAQSGVFAARFLAQVDIAPQIKSKIKVFTPNTGSIFAAIVSGELDIGFGQATEIRDEPSVAFLGPLPDAIQNYTAFSAAVLTSAKEAKPAGEFVKFLLSPAATEVMKAKGIQPPG